jgi:glycerophosphoryl diester phosphodiesterase
VKKKTIEKVFDVQGHRGCRGLFPENSIPAFLKAAEIGVHTLECDVVISKDNKVIVSHEPFMSHSICKLPDGTDIIEKDEMKNNIFNLTYEQIKTYDCGSKYFDRFPEQFKMQVHKPSLEDVVMAVQYNHVESLCYNIEIKYKEEWDGIYHPDRKHFADLLIDQINKSGIQDNTTVQCFDLGVLQYLHDNYPRVRLVYLIENTDSIISNIEKLGFLPHVYSPDYKLIDLGVVQFCQKNKIKLIPWTVNDPADMKKMIDIGVDGIISDYPNILIECLKNLTKD